MPADITINFLPEARIVVNFNIENPITGLVVNQFDEAPADGKEYVRKNLAWEENSGSGGGVTDHGALTGLSDDDHPQYHTDARGDARYSPLGHTHTPAQAGAEPANANIQAHIASTHAPSDAQKNSDITKAEIEAKLTGEITTHTHPGGGGGVTDHGDLTGLSDDDHPQYHTDARGDARYSPLGHTHTPAQVGLGNVDNTSDANKPVSTAQQTALDGKSNTSHTHTPAQVGLSNVDNTSDANKPVSTAQAAAIAVVQADIDTHEGLTNNPHGVTKSQIGLGNVDNTSDANKPVSTAQQTALDGKSNTDHTHTPAQAGAEPANANIQAHIASTHAPSDAQKNSDITKAEIEAKLTGQISTHTHAGGGVTSPITLPAITTPSTPPDAGEMFLYPRNRAGRLFWDAMGPSGLDYSLQTSLMGTRIGFILPNTGTTVNNIGIPNSSSGTVSHPALASTNFLTQISRIQWAITAGANVNSGHRSNVAVAWRGNAARFGGFTLFFRFAQVSNLSDGRAFIGLSAQKGVVITDPDLINNTIGIGYRTGDSSAGNWKLITRGTSATVTDLPGAPRDTTTVYDLIMFCKPNDTKITVRLINVTTDTVVLDNVEITTNLPANNVFLCTHAGNASGATSAQPLFQLVGGYLEKDY